jgi:hypothetical protein
MNSIYGYTEVATMTTAMLVVIGIFVVIGLACLALFIIGEWKVFKKAGYEGWISLVPFYNTYTLSKIVWGNGWLFLLCLIPLGGTIFQIATLAKLAKVFNKSTGFSVGMVFLPVIFMLILGMSSTSSYSGPNASGKTGVIIASAIVGGLYVIGMIISSVVVTLTASSLLNGGVIGKNIDSSYHTESSDAWGNYFTDDSSDSSSYFDDSSSYTDDSSSDISESSSSNEFNFSGNPKTYTLKNYKGAEIAIPFFDSDLVHSSDSNISGTKDGVYVSLRYSGIDDADIKEGVEESVKTYVSSYKSLYKNVTTDELLQGNGWCMQQINYSREDLNGNNVDCFTIIKEDNANGYPLEIEIDVNNAAANENTISTLKQVFKWYGVQFDFG